jgi:CHASE2 domain-containing sensor protein
MALTAHSFFAPRSSHHRVAAAITFALAAWGLGRAGLLGPLDGPAYDRFMRFRASAVREPPAILLVEMEAAPHPDEDAELADFLRQIQRFGARHVLFNFLPSGPAEEFYREVARVGNVLLPRFAASPEPAAPDRSLAAAGAEPSAHQLTFGFLHAPPSTGGVYRSHLVRAEHGGALVPTIEALAAERLLERSLDFPDHEYLVDFRGGPGSLPNVRWERVRAGDLIPELVAEKCVLAGRKPSLPDQGLCTPTTAGSASMSFLEYQGHALNTLLLDRALSPLNALSRLAILVTLALLANLAYQWLPIQSASGVAVAGTALYLAVSLVLFTWAGVWLPFAEVLLSQGAILLINWRSRALQLAASLQRVITDAAGQLREGYWPIHCRVQPSSWPLIANMINQTLDLNKLIFLEADSGTGRCREILALHCSLEDIVERRRDYSRPPYSDAISSKGPVKVKKFLRTKNPEEEQYLSPLFFGGELLGFWAVGIDAGKAAAIPQFTGLLKDYSVRIGELLHQTRKEGEKEPWLRALKRKLESERTDETQQELGSTLGLIHERLATLDLLIHKLNSGIIVYDIFGRVLQINEVVLALLKKENLAPFDMTALDLILALSDFDISKSRRLLRRVIVENSPVSFPVVFRSAGAQRFLLHLRPLQDETVEDTGMAPRRIGSRSILCELVNTTSLTALHEMKSRLTGRLGLRLRNDLAALELSAFLLGSDDLASPERGRVARLVREKVRGTIDTLGECRQYLALESDQDEFERFPVDPKVPLRAAVDEVREAAQKRGVTLQVDEPNLMAFVFASSPKLKDLFGAILRVLCQDAADNTNVITRVAENEDVVVFDFLNMGFGIPNELLQSYVFGEQQLASEEFQKIKAAARWVQSWGGMLEAVSGVGVGIHFTIHLVKFL